MERWLGHRRLALSVRESCAVEASKETVTEAKPSAANREYTRSFHRIKPVSTDMSPSKLTPPSNNLRVHFPSQPWNKVMRAVKVIIDGKELERLQNFICSCSARSAGNGSNHI